MHITLRSYPGFLLAAQGFRPLSWLARPASWLTCYAGQHSLQPHLHTDYFSLVPYFQAAVSEFNCFYNFQAGGFFIQ